MVTLAPEDDPSLIRLHPKNGGVNIKAGERERCFRGLSPDVFVGLDRDDPAIVRFRTCKLNLGVSVHPLAYSSDDFFSEFTCDATDGNPFDSKVLDRTTKCVIHGDEATGLRASQSLKDLLDAYKLLGEFDVGHKKYVYHSVGVAANPGYAAVSHRQGNLFQNKSSHLEVKFRRLPKGTLPEEYLCLNFHLTAAKDECFGKEAVRSRLGACLALFCAELRLGADRRTKLLEACLYVDPKNHVEYGFLCRHPFSQKALEKHEVGARHQPPSKGVPLFDYFPASLKEAKDTQEKKSRRATVPSAWQSGRLPSSLAAASRPAAAAPTPKKENPFPPLGAPASRR